MHGSRSRLYLIENDDDDDNNDDDDDKDDYSWNSVNFKVRTCRFCMEIDLDNIYCVRRESSGGMAQPINFFSI